MTKLYKEMFKDVAMQILIQDMTMVSKNDDELEENKEDD